MDMLGVLSLATLVREQTDYDVEVIDFQHEAIVNHYKPKDTFEEEIQQQYDYIIQKKPNIISFYTVCNNYHNAIALARRIKHTMPVIKVVFGGPQATLTANTTIREAPWVDVIAIGEGEKSIVNIMTTLWNEGDLHKVRGVVFKQEGHVINTGMPPLIKDLDELPMIDYSLMDYQDK